MLTSVYFDTPRSATKVHQKELIALKDLFREARQRIDQRRLPREQTESLEQDARRVLDFLTANAADGASHAYAVFACSGRGFFKAMPLPNSVEGGVYVDHAFRVRPLLAALDLHPDFCVAVVGREKGWILRFQTGRLENERSVRDEVPPQVRQSGWGGYLERRIERHIDTEVQRHYQHVGEELLNEYKRARFGRLLIAGHKEAFSEFEKYLHEELRRRIAGRFVIDANTAGAQEVRARAGEVLLVQGREEKLALLRQVFDNAGPRGLGVTGLEATLAALSRSEVQTLLVGDNIRMGGKRCANCGYVGGVVAGECPQCGTRLEAVDDVVEYALNRAVQSGAEVRFLDNSPDLERAGNLAALLRFRSELRAG